MTMSQSAAYCPASECCGRHRSAPGARTGGGVASMTPSVRSPQKVGLRPPFMPAGRLLSGKGNEDHRHEQGKRPSHRNSQPQAVARHETSSGKSAAAGWLRRPVDGGRGRHGSAAKSYMHRLGQR